jgi:hypothetical protein
MTAYHNLGHYSGPVTTRSSGAQAWFERRHEGRTVQAGRAPLPMIAGIGTTNSPTGVRKRAR